jgi:bifunctional enzyme CysN/CysC/sulfate adenylyltransferase subunit 1
MSASGFTPDTVRETSFRELLDAHLDQEMLRFTTAGSVDDGKSTLIGRLLHDTKSIYEDQLASIRASRVNRSGQAVDLSLLTDGLKAEREQGITIDVAYRYFSTAKRKFIIADTPGHEQYTRNMATGASTADVAIVLIDAKAFVKAGGLLPQSRRHTYIAGLLRIPNVVAAVNKMDLVEYGEAVFRQIRADFLALAAQLKLPGVEVIPVSALAGDNVVEPSAAMPWYNGPTLLDYLETVPLSFTEIKGQPLRFPVQLVVRPNSGFRGFAGRVERGEVRPGQRVRALPSGQVTRVKSIISYDGELKSAAFPRSVTLELEDEIDLSRGEMLVTDDDVAPQNEIQTSSSFRAMVVWMHEQPLAAGRVYLAKHTTRTVRATVRSVRYRVEVLSAEHRHAAKLHINDIGEVEFDAALPLFFDAYTDNREMGAMILIDPISNATVGAAMLLATIAPLDAAAAVANSTAFVWLRGLTGEATALCNSLRERGRAALIVDDELIPEASLAAVLRALQLAHVTAISARTVISREPLAALKEIAGEAYFESAGEALAWLDAPQRGPQRGKERP